MLNEDFVIIATFHLEKIRHNAERLPRSGRRGGWSYKASPTVEVSTGVKRIALKLFSTL